MRNQLEFEVDEFSQNRFKSLSRQLPKNLGDYQVWAGSIFVVVTALYFEKVAAVAVLALLLRHVEKCQVNSRLDRDQDLRYQAAQELLKSDDPTTRVKGANKILDQTKTIEKKAHDLKET